MKSYRQTWTYITFISFDLKKKMFSTYFLIALIGLDFLFI